MSRPKATYDRIGQLFEVYVIRQGGMGCVYLCIAQPGSMGEMPVPVALKTFHHTFWANEIRVKRFLQEAEIWVQIDPHPDVVRAYAVEIIDETPYIILEWIIGEKDIGDNLRGRISQGLSVQQCVQFGEQVCDGLCFISESLRVRGLTFVHGDIKPENLLISGKDNTIKVSDFGLSSVRAFASCQPSVEWEPGEVQFGTLDYMAPELFDGCSAATSRSDVYAFGCVIYEALCGCPPFQLDPTTATQDRRKFFSTMHAKYPPKRPMLQRRDVPPILDEFVMTCLEKSPERRYPDFEAAATALRTVSRGVAASSGSKRQTPKNPEEYIARGLSLMKLRRPSDAIKYFDQALEQDPESEKALVNKGLALAHISRHEEAVQCVEESRKQWRVVTWEKLAHYDTVRAAAMAKTGKRDDAFRLFDDVTTRYSNYAYGWFEKGVFLSDVGDYPQAVKCLTRCVEIESSFVSAWIARAQALLHLEYLDDAIDSLDWALHSDVRSAEAWQLRGTIFGRLACVEDALACYSKAFELDSNLPRLSEDRAALIAQFGVANKGDSGNGKQAQGAFRSLAEGLELARHNEWSDALQRYDDALAEDPSFAEAWSARGRALLMLGRNEEALSCFDKAFESERDRTRPGMVTPDASAASERRSPGELQHLADAIEERWRLANNPGKASDAYWVLARLARKKADFNAAKLWYLRYHSVNEKRGDHKKLGTACHQLGLTCADLRQYGEAKKWYLTALSIKPDDCDPTDRAPTFHQLGLLSAATGDRASARDWFMKAVAILEPLGKQGATYHELGSLAAGEKNWKEAKNWYVRSLALQEAELCDPDGIARTHTTIWEEWRFRDAIW